MYSRAWRFRSRAAQPAHAADRPEVAPSSARAAPSLRAVRNEGLCGRGLEGLQLMRHSLGGSNYHRGTRRHVRSG